MSNSINRIAVNIIRTSLCMNGSTIQTLPLKRKKNKNKNNVNLTIKKNTLLKWVCVNAVNNAFN